MNITNRLSRVKNHTKRFKTYSYTNTRVRVMRADLISDSEYRKLTKMELSGITEFLENRGYSDEINDLATSHSGEELIERALKRNLANTYIKLIDISPDDVQEMLRVYYRKFELENLKIILRRHVRERTGDVSGVLIPTPEMDHETLQRYLQMESREEIIDRFTRETFDNDLATRLKEAEHLAEMEDLIDTYYYNRIQDEAADLGPRSKLFTEFLHLEDALLNISLILRMKRQDHDYSEIMDRLVDIPETQQIIDNKELASQDSYQDALERVQDSPVGEHIHEDEMSAAEISRAIERYKLEKGIKMLHKDQLSINPILGFMICKEIEVSNLRMIVRAKEEELGEDFIERNLITGVTQ